MAQHRLRCLPLDDLGEDYECSFPMNGIDFVGRPHGFSEEFNPQRGPVCQPGCPARHHPRDLRANLTCDVESMNFPLIIDALAWR